MEENKQGILSSLAYTFFFNNLQQLLLLLFYLTS